MLSSMTNFRALNLFKFKVLFLSLLAGLFLIGCNLAPDITAQPLSATYNQNDEAEPLSVKAKSLDGGALSYQWYKNTKNSKSGGEKIDGATKSEYVPLTNEAGTFYYYATVTSTKNNVAVSAVSSVAAITVVIPIVDAQVPVITEQSEYISHPENSKVELSVKASVSKGELSYQWYTSEEFGNSEGEPIEGANEATYTLVTGDEGIFYYYVVVTNTDSSATGVKTVSNTSKPVIVIVTKSFDAEAPIIDKQPKVKNAVYEKGGGAAESLVVKAHATNGAELSYQWYVNDEEIPEATDATYIPPTSEAGVFSYYVKVSYTQNGVTVYIVSNTVTIEVKPIIYKVSFYDENLEYIETLSIEKGETIPLSGIWYLEGNGYQIIGTHNVVEDVNFYRAPNVKRVTKTELVNINNGGLNNNYILTEDIELTGQWEPIGTSEQPFTGIFNGNNHIVKGLEINEPSGEYIGFFGFTKNAQIKDLNVETTADGIKGNDNVGGIVGWAVNSNITDSSFTGSISGNFNVGGIAGIIRSGSTVTNSYSTGDIKGGGDGIVGGIVGQIDSGSKIANSYSTANVNGGDRIGGIAGNVIAGAIVTNSYSTGDVKGTSDDIGGVVGHIEDASVTNSYSTGSIEGGSNSVGGIVGKIDRALAITGNAAINPSVSSSITGYANRIIGHMGEGTLPNRTDNFAFNNMLVNGAAVTGAKDGYTGANKAIKAFKNISTYEDLGWNFGESEDSPWKIDAGKNDGLPYLYWQDIE